MLDVIIAYAIPICVMLCATVVELPIKYYQLIGEMIIYLRLK
jgi:hypothetical protein